MTAGDRALKLFLSATSSPHRCYYPWRKVKVVTRRMALYFQGRQLPIRGAEESLVCLSCLLFFYPGPSSSPEVISMMVMLRDWQRKVLSLGPLLVTEDGWHHVGSKALRTDGLLFTQSSHSILSCAQEDLLPGDSHYMGALGQQDTGRRQESIKALQGGKRKDKGEQASLCILTLDQIQIHIHRGLVDVLNQRDVKRPQHNILILNRTLSVMSRDTCY